MHDPKIMSLLRDTKFLAGSATVDWGYLTHMSEEEALHKIKSRAAQQLSSKFVNDFLQSAEFRVENDPLGTKVGIRGYCLTLQQLHDLMKKAYDLGRMDHPILMAP